MARIDKTAFISYRRADVYTALAVYENLKNLGYDIFFDYKSITSGDFEQIIASNIRARAHFLLILTPTALDRCSEPDDWVRREIELALDEKRNIVPLLFKGFRFENPSVRQKLTGKLKNLSRYNALNVHEDYFDEAMNRLRSQYLNTPVDTVLQPLSTAVQDAVREEQIAADKALEQIVDVKELVKQAGEKSAQDGDLPKPIATPPVISHTARIMPWRIVAGLAGGFMLIALGMWGGINVWSNPSSVTPESTQIPQPTATQTFQSPTNTSIPPVPTLGIGSAMISDQDGMTLLFVPAGTFVMGSDDGPSNEKPVREIALDAYWIDQIEVTNSMYALCVEAGQCKAPTDTGSNTRPRYYGNAEFNDYPVIYVDWNMAKTYCEWAGRRLPSEAEWERAARGTDQRVYPWGNRIDRSFANYSAYVGDTTAVRNYESGKSLYGAYDMAGNVWEWVSSLFKPYPYDAADGRENSTSSGLRVLRGGSWGYNDVSARATYRWHGPSDARLNVIGFRCSRSQ